MVWLGLYAWGSPDRTHSPRRFTTPAVARELARLIEDDALQSSRAQEASPPMETCPVSGQLLHFRIDAGEPRLVCEYKAGTYRRLVKKHDKFQTDLTCPTCGSPMVLRAGAHGPFAGCTAYPVCKKTLQVGRQCTPA